MYIKYKSSLLFYQPHLTLHVLGLNLFTQKWIRLALESIDSFIKVLKSGVTFQKMWILYHL